MLCYWYKPSKFGAAKLNKEPRLVTVLHINNDNTYTVEFNDGVVLDDVLKKFLKSADSTNGEIGSIWKSLILLRKDMDKDFEGDNIDPKYLASSYKISPADRIEKLLGHKIVDNFEKCYDDCLKELGQHWTYDDVARAFKMMRKPKKASDIEKWSNRHLSSYSLKDIDLWQFIVMYANLNYSEHSSTLLSSALGRTFNEKAFLTSFELTYGRKHLMELENVFIKFARKKDEKDMKMLAKRLMEAFTALGKAITVSKLSSWMEEADVHLHDTLSLADFAGAYVHLFPSKQDQLFKPGDTIAANFATISDVAIQVLREEKWSGSVDQTQSLISRLCTGRSNAVASCIGKIRNSFETLDTDNVGFLPITACRKLFQDAQLSSNEISNVISKFVSRMDHLANSSFSLPEFFEYFGSTIQHYADSMLSLSESVSLLRLRLSANDVHAALKLAMNIVENIVNRPTDSKYWFVNIDGEKFNRSVWQHEEGKKLMRSLGFGEPFEASLQKVVRRVISPRGVNSHTRQLSTDLLRYLKLRCDELQTEIVALEGAPTISAAIREMRLHHSLLEVRMAVETASKVVQNVLANPNDIRKFRIKKSNPTFQRNLGRMQGSALLMNAIGYSGIASMENIGDEDSSAYVLRPKMINTMSEGGKYFPSTILYMLSDEVICGVFHRSEELQVPIFGARNGAVFVETKSRLRKYAIRA